MKREILGIAVVATMLASTGCIHNDIPYPVVKLEITAIEANGTVGACRIDNAANTVVIPLDERTDIRNVEITGITFSERAHYPEEFEPIVGNAGDAVLTFDMRTPKYVMLSLYQDYEWTIMAEQNIERTFKIKGQMGVAEFDVENCTATAYIRDDYDLGNVEIETLKLGPREITEMSPAAEELKDFRSVRFVDVTYHERTEQWSLFVIPKEIAVEILEVTEGARVAWVRASGIADTQMGFRYRREGDEEWTEVPSEWITVDGGNISARLRHLATQTTYQVVAYADENVSEPSTFTTTDVFLLPNSGFEEWHFSSKNVYFPYLEGDTPFWGTGNEGSAITGVNISTPVSNDLRPDTEGEFAAQLKSANASVMGIAKFAAGNIYTGSYAGTIGTNGLVDFGRPYTLRPTGFRFWVKYIQGNVNCVPKNNKSPKVEGDPDEGIVYVALGDWDAATYGGTAESPYRVNTSDVGSFFTSQNPHIIAYGERLFDASVSEWTEMEIELEYRSSRRPTHIVIVCTASRFGDYFVGSSDSIMWVDDVELLYDFE